MANEIESLYKNEYESFKIEANRHTLKKKYRQRLLTVSILSMDLDTQAIVNENGVCDYKNNTIYINQLSYLKLSHMERLSLIDHELGHCVLLRCHYNFYVINHRLAEVNDSIMNYNITAYDDAYQMVKRRNDLFDKKYFGTIVLVDKKYENYKNRYGEESIVKYNVNKPESKTLIHVIEDNIVKQINNH